VRKFSLAFGLVTITNYWIHTCEISYGEQIINIMGLWPTGIVMINFFPTSLRLPQRYLHVVHNYSLWNSWQYDFNLCYKNKKIIYIYIYYLQINAYFILCLQYVKRLLSPGNEIKYYSHDKKQDHLNIRSLPARNISHMHYKLMYTVLVLYLLLPTQTHIAAWF